ncbi:MAG: TerC family protein [Chloroherpetonaceae bacterium]|nr:TerC family protein [Chloroherpetonaceae bacterium]
MFFDDSPLLWTAFFAIITFVLALDLGILNREAHRITPRAALGWFILWVLLAFAFAGAVWHFYGSIKGIDFITAYLIEKSLSVDNLFVFVLVFRFFRVEDKYQHRILFWGVLGAIVMRAIFIFAGVALIQKFHWITYLFGGFLIYTGIKLFFDGEEEEAEFAENLGIRLVKRFFSVSSQYDGQKFFTIENGRRMATPLFLVLVVIEITDLVFAVDSIPAVLAVSPDAFIVFTSNIFAIMGLRSMYFLLANIIDRFSHLKYGLAFILAFVGVKMVLAGINPDWKIPSPVSLAVVASTLAISIAVSLLLSARTTSSAEAPKTPAEAVEEKT